MTIQNIMDTSCYMYMEGRLLYLFHDPIYTYQTNYDSWEPACCMKGLSERASRRHMKLWKFGQSEDVVTHFEPVPNSHAEMCIVSISNTQTQTLHTII